MPDNGPYDSEDQARRAAHAVIPPEAGWSILHGPQNVQLLRKALDAAGVETAAYDDRILDWLGAYEDSICQVIAGWVARGRTTGTSGGWGHEQARHSVL